MPILWTEMVIHVINMRYMWLEKLRRYMSRSANEQSWAQHSGASGITMTPPLTESMREIDVQEINNPMQPASTVMDPHMNCGVMRLAVHPQFPIWHQRLITWSSLLPPDPMSDFADEYSVPPNLSDDVEMMARQDSEGQESDTHEQEMDDLFGQDDDHRKGAAASPTASVPGSERFPSPERDPRHPLEYEEEEEIAVEVKEARVKFPNLPVPKSSDGDSWVIRLPNFVSVDTKPFHPDTYMGPEQEDEDLQGDNIREKSMTVKLRVENTLRWRWAKDENGQDKRESNARVIRWSDGTLSLRLGKELFDITQSIDSSGRMSRSTLGGSQSQQSQNTQSSVPPSGKSEGLTYLVAQHKRSQILQAEALITGYMALRPTGMQSETHRLLVKAVGQKHNKVAKLRLVAEPTVDPEREKLELMKQSAKKSKAKRATHDEFGYSRKKRRRARSIDRDIYTDDEEETGMYAGEEEEDDEHRGSSPRKPKRKGREDTAEEYQADDFVVPDESDEDNAGARGKKKARGNSAEADDLEKMEAKMEKQAADRKHRGDDAKKSKKAHDAEMTDEDQGAMDVESEEEEFKVRRVAKRAIAAEEEEE